MNLTTFPFKVSLLEAMSHPNIVALRDVFAGNPIHLVFDKGGVDLRVFYSQASMSPAMAPRLTKQLLEAAVYLHRSDIIHCSIQPANLLVDAEGHLRLMGFEEARVERAGFRYEISNREAAQNGVHVGLLQYRAPEILMASTLFSFPVDVWAIGCIMAELAAKQAVFDADNIEDVLVQIFTLVGGAEESDCSQLCVYPGWSDRWAAFAAQPLWAKRFFPDGEGASLLAGLLTLSPTRLG